MAKRITERVTFENRPASAPAKDEFGRVRTSSKRQNANKDEVHADNQLYHAVLGKGFRPLNDWEQPHEWGVFHVLALDDTPPTHGRMPFPKVLRIEYASVGLPDRPSTWLGPMVGQWVTCIASPGDDHIDRVLLLLRKPLQSGATKILEAFEWCRWMTVEDFLASGRGQVMDLFGDKLVRTVSTTVPSLLTTTASIPASDRIVRINDNDPTASALVNAVAEVADVLEKSNSLPVPPDERRVLLREIRALLDQLQDKMVRLGALQAAISTDGILGYLKGKFPDHVMSGIIGAAISAIGALIESLL